MSTILEIQREARPYPRRLLEGCETGLILFAAAFAGVNDAVWFAEAGLETTCIDIDGERLERMAHLYPPSWDFLTDDAWEFAANVGDNQWDVVSADTFRGDATRRSLDSLDLWCGLAKKAVTGTLTDEDYTVPAGWNASRFERGDNVYWLVLERV